MEQLAQEHRDRQEIYDGRRNLDKMSGAEQALYGRDREDLMNLGAMCGITQDAELLRIAIAMQPIGKHG
jgi:hypothetical protein